MDHKELDVWKESMLLSEEIYKLTKQFPDDEKFGLVNQMRRSVISIPINISEGLARKTKKENLHFLNISIGSISELETQLILSQRLGYCNIDNVMERLIKVRSLLLGLRNYITKNL